MKKYLIIKADTNDADYITSQNEVTDEDLELIFPVIKAIEDYNNDKSIKRQKYNFWNVESNRNPDPYQLYVETGKCKQEEMDAFMEYCPTSEYGIHIIESIELLEVVKETKLL